MALLALKLAAQERFVARYVEAHREAFAAAQTEYDAAMLIQRWWRGTMVRKMIARWNASALLIQRVYRGWLGRKIYRAKLVTTLALLEKAYYDSQARIIQARWRGFYSRKHVHNYYARKLYLRALEEKNEIVREALRKHEEELQARLAEQRALEAKRKEEARLRHTHHQLSTKVLEGVHQTNKGLEERMRMLVRTEVQQGLHDGTLRGTLRQTLRQPLPPTATATTSTDLDCTCARTLPTPLPAVQGPFRPPVATQQARNRPLRPTLRVQTDFESAAMAKLQEKEEEEARRIHGQPFHPFSHTLPEGYLGSVRTSGPYRGAGPGDTRIPYGTTTFRDELPALSKSTAFKTVVPPIVFFDS